MTTLAAARATLYPLGLVISKYDDEFRVTFLSKYNGGKMEMDKLRQENLAYYTHDIDDAIRTGQEMARTYKEPNTL